MTDLNVAFTLRIKLFINEPTIVIKAYDNVGYASNGGIKLNIEVRQGGKIIFPVGALYCSTSPGKASDSNHAKELVLSLVAMKPGDTDDEFFFDYTPDQLRWAENYADAVSAIREDRYCDSTGNCR